MAEVKIQINAEDNASRVIQKTTGEISAMSKAAANGRDFVRGLGVDFDAITNPAQFAGQSIASLGRAMIQVANETAEYGKNVADVARQLGTTTEEASKLINIAGNTEIEFSSLSVAMRTAQRNGINPTIDSLKELGEQYKAIEKPADRAKFALDTFGRSGLEMVKILEMTPQALDEMISGIEAAGLVMDEKGVQSAYDYRMALNNFNDTITGLKNQLGVALLPALTAVIDVTTKGIGYWRDLSKMGAEIYDLLGKRLIPGYKDMRDAQDAAAEEQARLNGLMYDGAGAAGAYNDEIDEIGDQDRLDGMGAEADAWGKIADKIATADDFMQKYTDKLLFNIAAEGLSADQRLQLARSLGLVNEETKLAYDRVEDLRRRVTDGTLATDDYVRALEALAQAMNNVASAPTLPTGPAPTPGSPGLPELRAAGGPVYAGRPYIVGEQGPELFVPRNSGTIVNHQVTQNIYGAAGMSEQALALAFARQVERAL